MPTVAKKPSAKARAAVAEAQDAGPRLGKFRGVVLTLPPRLPGTFALDLAEMQATRNAGLLYTLVSDLAGHEGWAKIRAQIAGDGDALDDFEGTVTEIISALTDPYEVDEGK